METLHRTFKCLDSTETGLSAAIEHLLIRSASGVYIYSDLADAARGNASRVYKLQQRIIRVLFVVVSGSRLAAAAINGDDGRAARHQLTIDLLVSDGLGCDWHITPTARLPLSQPCPQVSNRVVHRLLYTTKYHEL